jgi:hypothetical protein
MSIWTLVWLDLWAGGKLGNGHSGETSFGPAEGNTVLLSLHGNTRHEFRSLFVLSTVYTIADCEESYFTIPIEFPLII